MSKSPAYARWLNTMVLARKESGDSEFEGCEEILAFISIREDAGSIVKMTDLVQSLLFGTGPTVHRKVSVLAKRGLIKISASASDGRAKDISLAKSGHALLKERSQQMALMLKS